MDNNDNYRKHPTNDSLTHGNTSSGEDYSELLDGQEYLIRANEEELERLSKNSNYTYYDEEDDTRRYREVDMDQTYFSEELYEERIREIHDDMMRSQEEKRRIEEIRNKPTDPMDITIKYIPILILIASIFVLYLLGWLSKILYLIMFAVLVLIIYYSVNLYIFKRPKEEIKGDIMKFLKGVKGVFVKTGEKFVEASDEIYYKYLKDTKSEGHSEYNSFQGVGNNPYERYHEDLKEEAEMKVNNPEPNPYYQEIIGMDLNQEHQDVLNKQIRLDKENNVYGMAKSTFPGERNSFEFDEFYDGDKEISVNGGTVYILNTDDGLVDVTGKDITKNFQATTEKLYDPGIKPTILASQLKIVEDYGQIKLYMGKVDLTKERRPIEYQIVTKSGNYPFIATQLEMIEATGQMKIRKIAF